MRIKIIVISVLFLLFAIIAAQNTRPTELKFLFTSLWAPLIVMIVVIFILGLIIGLVVCSLYERKKKKQELGFQKKKEQKNDSPKTNIS
jgi:uncharacterized integral membrane protein